MRVLVTGGRDYRNQRELFSVLDRLHAERGFTFLIHGDAAGADHMAHRWAKKNGVQPVAMEALWDANGKKDGSARNQRMLDFANPELVVAVDGYIGTPDMMKKAIDAGVELIDVMDVDWDDPEPIVGIMPT